MNILLLLIGLNPMYIFLFRRELLIEKKSFLILTVINIALFISSYILEFILTTNVEYIAALRMPVLSLGVFKILSLIYFRLYNTSPLDTFWSMDARLFKDGVFNLLFWILGAALPLFLIFR